MDAGRRTLAHATAGPDRRGSLHRALAVAVTAALISGGASLVAAGGGSPTGDTGVTENSADPGRGDVARLVDIGGGRSIYLQCSGAGSPTVVLVSGTGGAADEWTHVVGPAREPSLTPSGSAVFPTVAAHTRVCAYDRPGTTRVDDSPTPSTPVGQPTTAAQGVADLRAVLAAAGERGPYVLVGASWGAMITTLFARTDAARVAGLVTLDGASQYLRDTLTPAQWSDWMAKVAAADPTARLDTPDYPASVDQLRAAPAPRQGLPATVLTADHPWDLRVGDTGSTWPAWLAAQNRLAAELQARHITDTDSGHGIAVEQPRLTSNAVLDVVGRAGRGVSPSGPG
ncbi:alpha/beta fold hydrolase [Streptomyces poriticola]|uniref:alpha/beta fold hydrolase n=1 Tax=Streptomyces poriticola TaxID=3120506 RepID=UPI002FCE38C8